MTKVVQQHHHVALLCQRVPNTGKGRAGIEAVGRQFSHVVIKKHAIALGQLTLAEALCPRDIQNCVGGKPFPLEQRPYGGEQREGEGHHRLRCTLEGGNKTGYGGINVYRVIAGKVGA